MTQYKSARDMMRAMNEGKIPRAHLGPKNFLVLKQEIFSLKNEYKPDTFTEKEFVAWNKKMSDRIVEAEQLPAAEMEQLLKEVDKMLDPNS